VQLALDELVEGVVARVGDRVDSITLFGSHARGDARPDSDVDVFIVVDRRDRTLTAAIHDVALHVDLEHLTYTSIKICPAAKLGRMRELGDPLLAALEQEGKTLWIRTSKAASVTG
jgi:predicted nucleotidyltransferase